MKKYILILMLLILAACGGDSEEPADNTLPTLAPTAELPQENPISLPDENNANTTGGEVVDVITDADSNAAPAFSTSSLATEYGFSSYRTVAIYTFTGTDDAGTENSQSVSIESAIQTTPPASHIIMSVSGTEEESGSVEMTRLDNTNYMLFSESECISTPADGSIDDIMGDVTAESFLSDLEEADYIGTANINGINTYQYDFTEAYFIGTTGLEEATGTIYIAQDGGYLVRATLDATGFIDIYDQGNANAGSITFSFDLLDVDSPMNITVPASCENAEGDYPVYEGGYDVSNFGGSVFYSVEAPIEDVATFYDQALTAEGWTKLADESFSFEGSQSHTYTQDETRLTLLLTQDSSTNVLSVLLSTE